MDGESEEFTRKARRKAVKTVAYVLIGHIWIDVDSIAPYVLQVLMEGPT